MKFVTEKIKKLSVVDIMLIVVAMYAMYMLYKCTTDQKEQMEVEYSVIEPTTTDAPIQHQVPAVENESSGSCGAGNFVSSSLLPKSDDVIRADGFEFAPNDLQGMNFLEATDKIGVDTVGNSLRNANHSIRDEPANPKTAVSPWMNSTIEPDLTRLAL